jgi:hypothetical protein
LLLSDEIDWLVVATPTQPLMKGEIANWQAWIKLITEFPEKRQSQTEK